MFVWKSKTEVAQEKWAEGAYSYMKWFYKDMFRSLLKTLAVAILGTFIFRHRAELKEQLPTVPARMRNAVHAWKNSMKQRS